jgi:phage terminase Nu1 subunit (DNA packaging protein)
MAKQEKELFECSLNQLTQMTGMAYRTVKKKLMDAKLSPLRTEGRAMIYNCPDALDAIFNGGDNSKKLDLNTEKAKLTIEQRKKVRVERLKLEKTLVNAGSIKSAVKNMALAFRSKMLSIPSGVASEVLGMETELDVQRRLTEEIEVALLEFVTDDAILDQIVEDE